MKFPERLSQYPAFRFLSSIKITVACLFLLFVLTFWGTVAQINDGLYVAQARYFSSFFFLILGVIPFPGAQGVLWVLFVNLACVTATRFVHYFKPKYAGILVIHFGLLLYFVAAFVTFHVTVESNVHLMEHEGTNLSSSYHEWELSVWKQEGDTRHVTAFDAKDFQSGKKISPQDGIFSITVKQFYPNTQAYTSRGEADHPVVNASGIHFLEPKEILKEREQNIAGGVFEVSGPDHKSVDVLLYGGDSKATPLMIGGETYYFSLRHKKYVLPLTIELLDFRAQFHPGTQTAKSFESTVKITHDGTSREVVISMNNPLRYRDYTFYQASYAIDSSGNEYSTFAVVKNFGRILPYIASLLTFGGLALHFLMMAFASRPKGKGRRS
jgi:hypothetical protein